MSETDSANRAQPIPQAQSHESLVDGLTLHDLLIQGQRALRLLRRTWKLMAAGAVIGLALGILSAFVIRGQHSAVFEIRLTPKVADNPVVRYERTNVEFFQSAPLTFRSVPLIRQTLESMGEKTPSAQRLNEIQKKLTFYEVGYNTYSGRYTDRDPAAALKFLDTHVQKYISVEIEKTLRVIQAEVDFLKHQLGEVEKEMKKSEDSLRQFKEAHADGLPDQAKDHYLLLRGLQQKKIELMAKLEQTQLELKLNRDKLKGEKLFVESKVISTQRAQPYQDSIIGVKKDIAQARASHLREDHPEMQRLQALLASLTVLSEESKKEGGDTEVEKSRNPIFESIQDQIYQLEVSDAVSSNELQRIIVNMERAQKIVDKLPELEARFAEITRSSSGNQALYNKIYDQMKATELQLELERASSKARYDIISPPRIEFTSVGKRIAMLGILMAVAGTMVGGAIAAYREVRRILQRLSASS